VAVYEQAYRPYDGALTPERSRLLVLARFGLAEVFRSRILTGFYAVSFLPTLAGAIWIYLHHNLTALAALEITDDSLPAVDEKFFLFLLSKQAFFFGGILALFVGPPLVSRDLANGALPLVLSRPISRAEYVLGKVAALAAVMASVSLVPGILLFALQGGLEGWGWIASHLRLLAAIVLGCVLWIAVASLLVLAVATFAGRRVTAQAYLVGLIIAGAAIGDVLREMFDSLLGMTLNLPEVFHTLWASLFGVDLAARLPAVPAWIAAVVWCGVSLLILGRRLRAYEVVK
jgi:hypothetical protein